MKRFLLLALTILFLANPAFAVLKVATLNCFLFFSPNYDGARGMSIEPLSPEQYRVKAHNLAALIADSDVDVVGLQEIGSEADATELIRALAAAGQRGWKVCYVQGKDTYTGQNVAALVRETDRVQVVNFRRDRSLEGLSKHLVLTVEADGRRYTSCIVHLIRPIGAEGISKHARQLASLSEWSQNSTSVVVLGDFNDIGKSLLPLNSADHLTRGAPTHLSGKAFDHVYGTDLPHAAKVVRPPIAPKPNKATLAVWTDHYLLTATLP